MTEREKITADEFFALPETNHLVELIDGEVMVAATPVTKHQRLIGRAYTLLGELAPDGEAFLSPLSVYLDELNIPEPDVMWVSPANTGVVHDSHLFGAPDLIVEVFSPSTEKRDRKDKFELYERFGVREYWMIDPEPELIEVWVRVEDRFSRLGIYAPGEAFNSPVLAHATVQVNRLFGR
jgi:Uma2 family endonuclease